jgi:hypothetical protein
MHFYLLRRYGPLIALKTLKFNNWRYQMSKIKQTGVVTLTAVLAGMLVLACGGFDESAYSGQADGYITGLVTMVPKYSETEDSLTRKADPISGVRVFTNSGDETFSDEAGHFLLKVKPAERIVVYFEKEDHTSSIKTTSVGDWQTSTVMAVLKRREVFQVNNIQNGAAIVTTDGVAMTIQSDTLVGPSGEPASGAAKIACTLINPRNRGELEAAPGNLTAEDPRAPDQSDPALLRSYGMLEVVVTQDGEPLAFRDGAAANISVPFSETLPNDNPRGQGAPMWYFDEEQARWVQHGEAQIVEDGDGASFETSVTTVETDEGCTSNCEEPDGGVDGGEPDGGETDGGETDGGETDGGELDGGDSGGDRPWKPPTYPPKWWNIDVYGEPTGITGKVVDAVENGLPGAQVMVYVPADGQHTYTHTVDEGHFELYPVLANALNEIFAMLVVGKEAYTSSLHHYQTSKTSRDPATYEWVPEKGDQTSTIEIPVCFLAGQVHISYMLTNAGEEQIETVGGFAQFHNVLGGRDWCVDSFFKDDQEECRIMRLSDIEKLGKPGPNPLEYNSAGSHISVTGAGQEYYLIRNQSSAEIYYEENYINEVTRRPFFEQNYNVSAPGEEGGLPHFISNVPLFMPKMVTPRGILGKCDPSISAGSNLDLLWDKSGSTHHIYFMAHANAGGDDPACVICRMRDDGSYSVPASMLGYLGKGPATFTLFRYFVDYFALPSGAAVETVGQVGVSVLGEVN